MPISIDGTGSITGISVGGLNDGIITAAELASNSVTTVKITDSNVTTAKIADANVTPAKLSQPLTVMTAKAYNWNGSTTNSFLDFESIPSWARRITVSFQAVSTNGTGLWLIQLGTTSPTTSGYQSQSVRSAATPSVTIDSNSTGFVINTNSGSNLVFGIYTLTNITGNTWVGSGSITTSTGTAYGITCAGSVALANTVDILRVTNVGGSNNFDAGTVGVMYEG